MSYNRGVVKPLIILAALAISIVLAETASADFINVNSISKCIKTDNISDCIKMPDISASIKNIINTKNFSANDVVGILKAVATLAINLFLVVINTTAGILKALLPFLK